MKIPQQYITEAQRIRTSYLHNMGEILRLEKFIDVEKNKLKVFQEELGNVVKDPDISDVKKVFTLNNKLLDMDRSIKKVQDAIKPFYENIEQLRGDADRLYVALKERYPKIKKEEVQNELMKYIQ